MANERDEIGRDVFGDYQFHHRSRALPKKPDNWCELGPEEREKWEAFVSYYRDMLEDEDRGKRRKSYGF